jgi:hypothetical protein
MPRPYELHMRDVRKEQLAQHGMMGWPLVTWTRRKMLDIVFQIDRPPCLRLLRDQQSDGGGSSYDHSTNPNQDE